MKKVLISIILAITLCAAGLPALNARADASYEAVILDDADLLTDSEEAQLLSDMQPLTDYGNVIFSTSILSDGYDYEGACENRYYELFGQEPGVNFQIDMGNRKLTLSASTGMEDLIGSERDSIVDNIYTYATDGNYLACAQECFSEIYTVVNDGAIAHNMKYIDNGILALIISLVLNFIIVFAMSRKKKSEGVLTASVAVATAVASAAVIEGALTKRYSPVSSSSGGGGGSSGGGGGGGFSGGSSSHGF